MLLNEKGWDSYKRRVWMNFTKINERIVKNGIHLLGITNRLHKLQCCIMSAHFMFINSRAVCYKVPGNVSDINMLRDICLPNIKWSCSRILISVIVEVYHVTWDQYWFVILFRNERDNNWMIEKLRYNN